MTFYRYVIPVRLGGAGMLLTVSAKVLAVVLR